MYIISKRLEKINKYVQMYSSFLVNGITHFTVVYVHLSRIRGVSYIAIVTELVTNSFSQRRIQTEMKHRGIHHKTGTRRLEQNKPPINIVTLYLSMDHNSHTNFKTLFKHVIFK